MFGLHTASCPYPPATTMLVAAFMAGIFTGAVGSWMLATYMFARRARPLARERIAPEATPTTLTTPASPRTEILGPSILELPPVPETLVTETTSDFYLLTNDELKVLLRGRGKKVTGVKDDLVKRLQAPTKYRTPV